MTYYWYYCYMSSENYSECKLTIIIMMIFKHVNFIFSQKNSFHYFLRIILHKVVGMSKK